MFCFVFFLSWFMFEEARLVIGRLFLIFFFLFCFVFAISPCSSSFHLFRGLGLTRATALLRRMKAVWPWLATNTFQLSLRSSPVTLTWICFHSEHHLYYVSLSQNSSLLLVLNIARWCIYILDNFRLVICLACKEMLHNIPKAKCSRLLSCFKKIVCSSCQERKYWTFIVKA